MNALDVLYGSLAVVLAPWWLRKARGDWPERFGKIAPVPAQPGNGTDPAGRKPRLLVHAVSVGEVNALRSLMPLLTAEAHVILSVGTDTGIARARAMFGRSADVVRYPLDFSWSVRRFLDAARPDAVTLVELELWPNFVRECRRRSIPVTVINGRLSPHSFRGYWRLRRWIGSTFASLEFAAVQDADYAARFETMGVEPGRCLITGSMKWDTAVIEDAVPGSDELARDLGIDRARPLIVAGSTGPGEEAILHAACPAGAQLLCAPRKPERFDEAAVALPGCIRRSARTTPPSPADRYLLDTLGELRHAYALADVVVVGRSFVDLHGSDPIEPIGLGKATVVGPSVANFASIVETFERAGGVARATRDDLPTVLTGLLADPARRRALCEAGRACIREHQGASARHAELLLALLDRARTPPAC
ncbi:MAG: 3-deoxy-D-manno-octulosonic acid transferase [Phycisphaerales bacterium]